MREKLKLLEKAYGSQKAAADALGYSDRQFRNWLNKTSKTPKAVLIAIDRLLEIQNSYET